MVCVHVLLYMFHSHFLFFCCTQEASDPADLEIGLAAEAAARANQLLYRVRVRYTTLRGGAGTEPERKILMGYAVK